MRVTGVHTGNEAGEQFLADYADQLADGGAGLQEFQNAHTDLTIMLSRPGETPDGFEPRATTESFGDLESGYPPAESCVIEPPFAVFGILTAMKAGKDERGQIIVGSSKVSGKFSHGENIHSSDPLEWRGFTTIEGIFAPGPNGSNDRFATVVITLGQEAAAAYNALRHRPTRT